MTDRLYFECRSCGQILAVSQERQGQQIVCPVCGTQQPALPTDARSPEQAASLPAGESVSGVKEQTDSSKRQPHAAKPPPVPARARESETAPRWAKARQPSGQLEPPVPNYVLVPRPVLGLQALLILLASLAGLAIGILLGRADGPQATAVGTSKVASEENGPITLQVYLFYKANGVAVQPDVGAVLIGLPADKTPDRTLTIHGLRPEDNDPDETRKAVERIIQLGGTYDRADEQGLVAAVFPQPGKYYLLAISQGARKDHEGLSEDDRNILRPYFFLADDLVGSHCYRLQLLHIDRTTKRIQWVLEP